MIRCVCLCVLLHDVRFQGGEGVKRLVRSIKHERRRFLWVVSYLFFPRRLPYFYYLFFFLPLPWWQPDITTPTFFMSILDKPRMPRWLVTFTPFRFSTSIFSALFGDSVSLLDLDGLPGKALFHCTYDGRMDGFGGVGCSGHRREIAAGGLGGGDRFKHTPKTLKLRS